MPKAEVKKMVAMTMLRRTKREVGVNHPATIAATSTIFLALSKRESRIVHVERDVYADSLFICELLLYEQRLEG